jgi:hypothetical protein
VGGGEQEDQGSKPAGIIVHKTLSRKYLAQERAGGVAQAVEYLAASLRPSVQTPVLPKEKKVNTMV